ncbi:Uncharacterised protein [Legionella busanensis]|uniref:Uncharacterized protein n=1 Tax=Legionella busanensis TaxID=190655 RepID=A0A378JJ26_9GAMM|nr:hypothetical protein [Legionella busanensis]STX50761.1 Uncharacterised protein [Legionella busanensis]
MKEWQIIPMTKGRSWAGYTHDYDPDFEMYPDAFTAFFEKHVFQLKLATSLNELKLVKFATGKVYLSFSTQNEQQLNGLIDDLLKLNIPCEIDKMSNSSTAWHTKENGWSAYLPCSIYDNGLVATKEQLGTILIEISKIHPFSAQMAQSLKDILNLTEDLKFTLAVPSLKEQSFRYIQNNINFFSPNEISNLPLDLREQIKLSI